MSRLNDINRVTLEVHFLGQRQFTAHSSCGFFGNIFQMFPLNMFCDIAMCFENICALLEIKTGFADTDETDSRSSVFHHRTSC
jgi:hypothetical protein